MQSDLKSLRRDYRKAREMLVEYEAGALISEYSDPLLVRAYSGREPEEIRKLAAAVVNGSERAVVFSLKGEGRVFLFLGCSPGLGLDMRSLVEIVSPHIEGRGGGPPSLVQVAGPKEEGLDSAVSDAISYIEEKLGLTL